jgi:hypothetical protein
MTGLRPISNRPETCTAMVSRASPTVTCRTGSAMKAGWSEGMLRLDIAAVK